MAQILDIIHSFEADCPCGRVHRTAVEDVVIESGARHRVGEILQRNHFAKTILFVADQNTSAAAAGIEESLSDFTLEYQLYDDLRVATMECVAQIEERIAGRDISVLSVGTGSLHDICRLACARQKKRLCLFATAPSMDGFASYGAPIVCDGFKSTWAAKSPEVIIGDTEVLAAAPDALKSAGFGDMVAKYVGLIDWQVSTLLTGEYYCERIAALTRDAVDELMTLADRVTARDEYTAGKIFEALLKTGIGMSFTQNSRPASGSEHIVAHLIECLELPLGKLPNLHGDDVGVCTLEVLRIYGELAAHDSIEAAREVVDWDAVYAVYGDMAPEVQKLNFPHNVIDDVDPAVLSAKWGEIVQIIHSVPDYETCRDAMARAHCKLTVADIEKEQSFFDRCMRYSPYMRHRLTLLRMRDMIHV